MHFTHVQGDAASGFWVGTEESSSTWAAQKAPSIAVPLAWDKPAQGLRFSRGFIWKRTKPQQNQTPRVHKPPGHPSCPSVPSVSFSTAVYFVECLLLFRAPDWSSPASGASDPAVPRPSLLPSGSRWGTPICAASSICSVMMLLQMGHLQVHLRAAALLKEPKGAVIQSFSEVSLLR